MTGRARASGRVVAGLLVLIGAAVVGSAPAPAADGEVTARSLNIRSGPGTRYAVINSVKRGTKLPIDKVVGLWVKIKWQDEAWVLRRYIKLPKQFQVDKELAKQDAFLDWAAGSGHVEELSIEGPGRISVVLVSARYGDRGRLLGAARKIACGYRDKLGYAGEITVTVWTAPGPGRREVARTGCE